MVQAPQNKSGFAFLILSVTLCNVAILKAATNAVPYKMKAIIELKASAHRCTGSIIGNNPIKVLTAVHCLENSHNGGLAISSPSDPTKEILSKAVYVSADPVFKEKLAQLDKFKVGIAINVINANQLKMELDQQRKKMSPLPVSIDVSKSLRNQNAMAFDLSNSKSEQTIELRRKLDAEMRSYMKLTSAKEELNLELGSKMSEHEIAILVFEESLPGNLSDKEHVANGTMLPLAKNEAPNNSTVIIGGFGRTGSPKLDTQKSLSRFTTNEAYKHPERDGVYLTYAYSQENVDKHKIKTATKGSLLPGDPGGALLSEAGISGVTSMYRNSFATHTPPVPNWISLDGDDAVMPRYEYSMNSFASTTSAVAQEIFARVEAEVSPLVYTDDLEAFADSFYANLEAILTAPAEKRDDYDVGDFIRFFILE